MSKLEKALERLARKPKDFAWTELTSLLASLDIAMTSGAGSVRCFGEQRHRAKAVHA